VSVETRSRGAVLTVHKLIIVYVDLNLNIGEKGSPAVGLLTALSKQTQLDSSVERVILNESWVKSYDETGLRNE
jgi:hypothetical protein